MIMQDYVKPEERVSLLKPALIEYAGKECFGCGRSAEQIANDEDYNDEDFENNSRTTWCGNWYHHIDCFKDSRG